MILYKIGGFQNYYISEIQIFVSVSALQSTLVSFENLEIALTLLGQFQCF